MPGTCWSEWRSRSCWVPMRWSPWIGSVPTWPRLSSEAGLTVAADLLAGNDDVRPRAADMLRRGLAGIPELVRARAAAADRLRTSVSKNRGQAPFMREATSSRRHRASSDAAS